MLSGHSLPLVHPWSALSADLCRGVVWLYASLYHIQSTCGQFPTKRPCLRSSFFALVLYLPDLQVQSISFLLMRLSLPAICGYVGRLYFFWQVQGLGHVAPLTPSLPWIRLCRSHKSPFWRWRPCDPTCDFYAIHILVIKYTKILQTKDIV